jgi:hypothetical protein
MPQRGPGLMTSSGAATVPGSAVPVALLLEAEGISSHMPTPATAPLTLVQMFLQSLPDAQTHGPAAWMLAVTQAEATLRLALDSGVDAVTAWRNVPPPVVEAAREARAVVNAALSDEGPSPMWLRPEWLGLAPRMERFWRRRRHARRVLSDPDYPARWDVLDAEDADRADKSDGRGR